MCRYFNLAISPSHLFTRCCVCNSDAYITVPQDTMKSIRESIESRKAAGGGRPPPDFDEEEGDDFDDFGACDDACEDEFGGASVEASPWLKLEGGELNCVSAETKRGVAINVMDVPAGVVEQKV